MENRKRVYTYPLLTGLKKYLLDGLTVIVPVVVTVLLLVWLFDVIDGVLQPFIRDIYGRAVTGLGFLAILELVLLAGIMVNSRAGRSVLKVTDSGLAKMPIFGSIYFAIKTMMESLVGAGVNKHAFRKVVFVEWPSGGMKTIAFITNEQEDPQGRKLYSVYIPTSPTPQSGFYMIAYDGQVSPCDLGVDEAMKMVISAGMVSRSVMDIGGPRGALGTPPRRARRRTR